MLSEKHGGVAIERQPLNAYSACIPNRIGAKKR